MAELLIVKDDLTEQGWVEGAVLVKDETTGQHYVLSTAQMPWAEIPETLVYTSDAEGSAASIGDAFVAGASGMTRDDAMADLNARIDTGSLLTVEEAVTQADREDAEDFGKFLEWAGLAAPSAPEAQAG